MMNRAQEFFNKGDYESAIGYFDEVLEINSNKMEAAFYKGESQMVMNEYAEANESFTMVIEHNDNLYVQKAEWYQAGCLLAMNETELARRKFASIAATSNHYYRKDAEKILKRMK
jgi:tetratricopeptide (TPR) repeat protein